MGRGSRKWPVVCVTLRGEIDDYALRNGSQEATAQLAVILYRLEDPRVVIEHVGLPEILSLPAVVAIEWGEKVPIELFGDRTGEALRPIYRVELLWIDETTRQVTIRRDSSPPTPSGA